MPKSFNQKLKILYLMQAFLERTDREHPMSVPDLILYLDGYGISVERKTVYEDIETLRIFGMKIENRREKPSGYYLADRDFSFPELKILMGCCTVVTFYYGATVTGTGTQAGTSDQHQ